MSELIIQTRLEMPSLPENIISRERLNSLIRNNISKKLIYIEAPAGYGKTTLAADFLISDNSNYAWYRVPPGSENFYTFFNYLTGSLSKLNPSFGINTKQIIDSSRQSLDFKKDQSEIIESVLGTFVNDIQNYLKSEIIIVIDDFHNVKGGWIRESFNFLFDNIPANLHFIMLSREKPGFNLSKLKSKRMVAGIKASDILFNKDETEMLLKSFGSVSGNIALSVHEKLDGWITGIHLLLQANNFNLTEDSLSFEYIPGVLYNYFASEIFDNLPDSTRNFLLASSLLDEFSPGMCNDSLDINNSAEIIDELYNKNIFIEQISEGFTPVFKYHALFKSFLIKKLQSLKTPDEINEINLKIAGYFRKSGDTENQISFLLKCGKYDDALNLINQNFYKFFINGRHEQLWGWLKSFPENIKNNNDYIRFYLGKMYYFYLGELEPALEEINLSLKLLKKKNKRYIIKAMTERTKILVYMGRFEEALKDAAKMMKMKAPKEDLAYLYYSAAAVYYSNTDYDKCLAILEKTKRMINQSSQAELEVSCNSLIGNIHLARGEFVKAQFFLESVAEKISNVYKKLYTLTNLSELNAYSGRYEQSKEYLAKAENILRTFPSPYHELYILLGEGYLRFECGDYEETLKIQKKVSNIGVKSKYNYYIYFSNIVTALCYYYLGKYPLSYKHLKIAESVTAKDRKYRVIEIKFLNVLLEKKNFTPRKAGKMERNLLKWLKYNKSNKFYYDVERILFHISHLYILMGKHNEAKKYLSEALTLAAGNEYFSFLEREYLNNREVFDFAVENNIGKELIKKVHSGIAERAAIQWVSSQAAERQNRQIESIWDIEMEAFGALRFKVRGHYIPESVWVRKKSRLVLCWLMLNKDKKLNKEILLDMFFSELSADSAENVFHQVIHDIKNVISNSFNGNEINKPELVKYEHKNLFLNPSCNYISDAEKIESIYQALKTEQDKIRINRLVPAAKNIYKAERLKNFKDTFSNELRNQFAEKVQYILSLN